jgi:hypothetical protein
MPITSSVEAISELQRLIDVGYFGSALETPTQLAQFHLALAAQLLETAAFEIAQTPAAPHTLTLLELSLQANQISKLT